MLSKPLGHRRAERRLMNKPERADLNGPLDFRELRFLTMPGDYRATPEACGYLEPMVSEQVAARVRRRILENLQT